MSATDNLIRITQKITSKIQFLHLDWLVLFPLFFAVSSQIILPIPFLPVPLSLQPLPVFLAAWFFRHRGVAGYAIYLIQGLAGAPIFSGFSGGIIHLTGPTGGYLVGFFFGAIIIARLKEAARTRLGLYGIYSLATAVTFFFGIGHLSFLIPLKMAITCGLVPFIIGDFFFKPAIFVLTTKIKNKSNT